MLFSRTPCSANLKYPSPSNQKSDVNLNNLILTDRINSKVIRKVLSNRVIRGKSLSKKMSMLMNLIAMEIRSFRVIKKVGISPIKKVPPTQV